MNSILGFIFGIMFGAGIAMSNAGDKECTVTIKDHQGAFHVLKGVADET